MQNLEKTKEFGSQFSILFDFYVLAVQPNFVIRSIVFGVYGFIINLFLKLLGIIKVFRAN